MTVILITGSSGFVGQNLIKYLPCNEFKVNILQRLNSKPYKNTDQEFTWRELCKNRLNDVEAVIHLAGKAHDIEKTSNPLAYFEVNTELTKKLFNVFLESNTSLFIYVSSVKAVADTVDEILTEDVIPDPQTPYGQSKRQAEEYILRSSIPEGKRVFILRPCMIHGPGNKGNLNLLYNFVNKGFPYPLAIFENHRSFLSIENLCFVIQRLITDDSIQSGIYNVADDEALSTVEVIEIISETLQRKPKLLNMPKSLLKGLAKVGDTLCLPINSEKLKRLTENYVVSNDKIKNALKIKEMPVSCRNGLKKTIQSFRSSN